MTCTLWVTFWKISNLSSWRHALLHGSVGHYSTPDRNQPWKSNVIERPKLGAHKELPWDWLAAGGCVPNTGKLLALSMVSWEGMCWAGLHRRAHTRTVSLLREMSLFWKYVMDVSSRGKTKILLLLRTNTRVKGWGIFDFYALSSSLKRGTQAVCWAGKSFLQKWGTSQLCLQCTVKWVLHPSQKI